MAFKVRTGDVAEVCATLPENSFDACLTDPPYGLSFMGKAWDHAVPGPDVWREVWRVLKPGACMLAFGGTRTYHRLACAIEDAGFEIRDCMMWLYGSGFPKSHDISKAIDKAAGAEREVVGRKTGRAATPVQDMRGGRLIGGVNSGIDCSAVTAPATDAAKTWNGYGTALKPAYEPILLCMKPTEGTFAQNALKHGTGGLAIDACRIGTESTIRQSHAGTNGNGWGMGTREHVNGSSAGRWPANLLLDEEAAAMLDEQSGVSKPKAQRRGIAGGNKGAVAWSGLDTANHIGTWPADPGGGASRFFYVAKASTRERGAGNVHPTVKPIALNAYLARLILPPTESPRLLVSFSGSGSEILGAREAGWKHVMGIELNPKYVSVANRRLRRPANGSGSLRVT